MHLYRDLLAPARNVTAWPPDIRRRARYINAAPGIAPGRRL
jgi:hypothetical protein